MQDRPTGGSAAILVSLDLGGPDYQESLQEMRQLVISAGIEILDTLEGRRAKPDAKYFLGTGKA
ncbi:MAG TPA: GTPase HflX, partial [Methylophilaceae bacterium]|nr:GTPase HflX [Methylophilaceae bacterium]